MFTHDQLYVAASRVRSFNELRFYISDTSDQGHLFNDNRVQKILFIERFWLRRVKFQVHY